MSGRRVVGKIRHACLAGLLTGAHAHVHAQGSVTLYGVVDGGLLYLSKTAAPAGGQPAGKQFSFLDSGYAPSQFGLFGTEDLGGGLRATFKLESGISVANGGFNNSNGFAWGRQAWMALGGRFGEVKAGLQPSPFFLAVYASDPRQMALFGSGLLTYGDAVLATGIFNANALSYTTPRWFGLAGSVMFAPGGKAGDFRAGRQYSASLDYAHGGLTLVAAMYDGNAGVPVRTPVPSDQPFVGRTLGAAYTWGKLTAKASWTRFKVAGSFSSDVYGAGADCLVAPAFDLNGGVWITSDRNDPGNHSLMFAMGAQYFLSKATTLYAQVGMVNNHGAMNTGLSATNALFGASGTTTGVNAGLRHVF
ncbi:porin [Burkholderia aenigmatica]|uniref:porin n=1 Tax=Burkholderia aenigmatica TaxID=2015348 RepID=UPI003B42E879